MIITRKANSTDIDGFKKVVNESVLELCKNHYTTDELQSLLAQYPNRQLYEMWLHERVLVVAEDDGKIIGFAQYFPPDGSLEAVHVLPAYVNMGVGKMVVELIEDIAKTQGAKKITLGSSLNAVGFYEKCGYSKKETGSFKCNNGVELGVINFEKQL